MDKNSQQNNEPAKHSKVCSDHFIGGTGKVGALYDTTHPDWVPTLMLTKKSGGRKPKQNEKAKEKAVKSHKFARLTKDDEDKSMKEETFSPDEIVWRNAIYSLEKHWTCTDLWQGYTTSFEKVQIIRKLFENVASGSFVAKKDVNLNYEIDIDNDMVLLDDSSDSESVIPFDGMPFIKLGDSVYYECCCEKNIKEEQVDSQDTGHGPKEVKCPARITMKVAMKFPQIEVTDNAENLRLMASDLVRQELRMGEPREVRYYIRLPPPSSHQHHHGAETSSIKMEEKQDAGSCLLIKIEESDLKEDTPVTKENQLNGSSDNPQSNKHENEDNSSVSTVYRCNVCSYTTLCHANLYKHKIRHRAQKTHQCAQCEYTCRTASNLKRHEATHLGLRLYLCAYCPKRFAQMAHLKTHTKRFHTNKKHVCGGCNEGFDMKRELEEHMKREHRSKIGVSKEVTRADGATQHVYECQTTAFLCQYCDVSFENKKSLQQHEKLHIAGPEMKYFCTECSFITHSVAKLERHKMSHTGLKPYQCSMCKFCANQKEHVVRHIRAKHKPGDTPNTVPESNVLDNVNREVLEQDILQKLDLSNGQVQLSALDPVTENAIQRQLQSNPNLIVVQYNTDELNINTTSSVVLPERAFPTGLVVNNEAIFKSHHTPEIKVETAAVNSVKGHSNSTCSRNQPVVICDQSSPSSTNIHATNNPTLITSDLDMQNEVIINTHFQRPENVVSISPVASVNQAQSPHIVATGDQRVQNAVGTIIHSGSNQEASSSDDKSNVFHVVIPNNSCETLQSGEQQFIVEEVEVAITDNELIVETSVDIPNYNAMENVSLVSVVEPISTRSQIHPSTNEHTGHVKIQLNPNNAVDPQKQVHSVSCVRPGRSSTENHLIVQHRSELRSRLESPAKVVAKPKYFGCNFCSMTFSKLLNLYKHIHTMHKEGMTDEASRMKCVVCSYMAPSKKSLLSHMRHHTKYEQTHETNNPYRQ